jgi:hypothetical protein
VNASYCYHLLKFMVMNFEFNIHSSERLRPHFLGPE